MATPKLLEAVYTLTTDEWSSFGKYLLTKTRPNSDHHLLFKVLLKNKAALLEDGKSDKIRVKHFTAMTSKTYSNLLSRLFLYFEEWFSINMYLSSNYEKELLLIKGYNQKGLFKLANNVARNLVQRINSATYKSLDQQTVLKQLHTLQYFSNNPIKKTEGHEIFCSGINAFLSSTEEQALFLLLELENRTALNHQDLSQARSNLEGLIQSKHSELSQTMTLCLEALRDPSLDHIINLKTRLNTSTILPSSDLYLALTIYLRKALNKVLNKNICVEAKEVLEIYQLTLSAMSANPHQKLLPVSLINAVAGLSLHTTYEETETLIQEWVPRTFTKYPESLSNYCNASNLFIHNRYDEAIDYLIGLEFDNINIKASSQAMLIIAHYMNDAEDLALTMAANFKKQLSRNKSKLYRADYLGLYNFTKVLPLIYKSKYDKSIIIDLKDYERLAFRNWVVKQIEKE